MFEVYYDTELLSFARLGGSGDLEELICAAELSLADCPRALRRVAPHKVLTTFQQQTLPPGIVRTKPAR